ncbi:MAG: hypothetical protein U0325_30945 [Polyangiales bacterium]
MSRVSLRHLAAWGAAPLAVAALAVKARAALAPMVFADGEVTPVEVDAFLHLRRVARTLADVPRVPWRDPWIDWPTGAVLGWPEGFDAILALAARALGGGTPYREAVVVAWAPVALGVVVTLGAWAVTARLLRGVPGAAGAALLAGLFTALAPQSVATSMVGRVDHHVAEQLAVLGLMAWCAARPDADHGRAAGLRFEAVGAVILGLSLWCFNGSVLYAALATAVLVLAALHEPARRPLVGQGALAFLPAAAFVAWRAHGAVVAHGRPFDHLFTSYLQPTLLAAGGAAVAVAALTARALPDDRSPARRLARRAAALSLVGGGLLALALAALPPLRAEVGAGLHRWLAREDGYMASISEVQPLFSRAHGRSPREAVTYPFGWLGLVFPVAAVAGVAWLRARRGALALAVFTAGLSVLWVLQMRFGRTLAPIAGVCLGVGAAALASRVRVPAAQGALPFALAALAMLDPRARIWLRARPAATAPEVTAARFLRAHAPVGAPVFTTWGDGNAVLHVAARPVLVSSFGSYTGPDTFWRAERAWLGDEAGLDAFLAPRGVRWMVAGATHFGGRAVDPDGPDPLATDAAGRTGFDPRFFRRVPLAALVLGGGGAPRTGVAHLQHWRPRTAVGVALRGPQGTVPALWVYERVPGATLTGSCPDGARVTLTTTLLLDGAPQRHVAWTHARGATWRITTPLPTGWSSGNLRTGGAQLRVGDGPARAVVVDEAAVRDGATLRP